MQGLDLLRTMFILLKINFFEGLAKLLANSLTILGGQIMSKMSKEVSITNNQTVNFMGGLSYTLDPLTTLRMVCASSIFGESQYYRKGTYLNKHFYRNNDEHFKDYFILEKQDQSLTEYMETIIDNALNYDFKRTIEFASELRNFYNIRINPQVIMVRAAIHPKRTEFTNKYPGLFNKIQKEVMQRADEPSTQFCYYLLINNSKKNSVPSILKRSWANKLSSLSKYQVSKYKNHECGMVNTIRVCHANSEVINELMITGKVEVSQDEMTWENLKSEGKTWLEIINSGVTIPHMALLRNLRGIFLELNDSPACRSVAIKITQSLIKGTKTGKQYPYRYYIAYKNILDSELPYKVLLLDSLEECLQISLHSLPLLKGKTMVLSDNSGSTWGTLKTEFGSIKVAEIGNLSAVLTAMHSEEGYVGVFGDTLIEIPIRKNDSILSNLERVNREGQKVGFHTENGIWLFFENSIMNHTHWDNVFVYSDMQAGRGELYCTSEGLHNYVEFGKKYHLSRMSNTPYINILELVDLYRKTINSKLNIFSIQTAGYNNNILPNYLYRGSLLSGWTGKELLFAKEIIDNWNKIENRKENYYESY